MRAPPAVLKLVPCHCCPVQNLSVRFDIVCFVNMALIFVQSPPGLSYSRHEDSSRDKLESDTLHCIDVTIIILNFP